MTGERLSTGNSQLDELLGGGLLPGKLTVILGATGIGKTQLGLQFAHAGKEQEGEPGILFDMTSRGDSQNHGEYARRMFGWELTERELVERIDPAEVWNREQIRRDYFHVFRHSGRRVTISDLEHEQWKEWKVELTRKLDQTISFFYGNFVNGVRRCVIDGVEPTDRASDSFQFHLFEYLYHQILHKEADWVARDLFRVKFREHQAQIESQIYDHTKIGCLILATSHEVMLEDLISRPIETGDILSNANTIILMGKIRNGLKMGRALQVAKHRGSACDESLVPFDITEQGLQLREEL